MLRRRNVSGRDVERQGGAQGEIGDLAADQRELLRDLLVAGCAGRIEAAQPAIDRGGEGSRPASKGMDDGAQPALSAIRRARMTEANHTEPDYTSSEARALKTLPVIFTPSPVAG